MVDRRSRSRSPPASVPPWRREQVLSGLPSVSASGEPVFGVTTRFLPTLALGITFTPRRPSGYAAPSVPSGFAAPVVPSGSSGELEAEEDLEDTILQQAAASVRMSQTRSGPSMPSGSSGSSGDPLPLGETLSEPPPPQQLTYFTRWLMKELRAKELENVRLRAAIRQFIADLETSSSRPPREP